AAYLDNCNPMLEYVEQNSRLNIACENDVTRTEYCPDIPGGKPMGRKVWPNPEVMPQILAEVEKTQPMLAKVRKQPFILGSRPLWARGRALIGPLVAACAERHVSVFTNTPGVQLMVSNGRVIGVRAQPDGRDFFVRGRKGVLLATGGFEWNSEMNKRFIYAPELYAYTAPSNEGDGHIMGMEVGAALALMDHSILQPGLSLPNDIVEGGRRLYRPFISGYPGMIFVNRHGRRCCNECFYPDIGRAFVAYDRINGEYANWPLFFVCDQSFRDTLPILTLRKGTEMVEWIRRSDTLSGLAETLGIPGNNLIETVERFNGFAREGRDPDFHRGEGTYDRQWGEALFPGRKPSSVLGPLEKPPFYGVKLGLTTAGNLGGLVTNAEAQVIDVRGEIIPGLYCTSNTQAMLPLGHHYDSGAAQGKSMVFGYIAARCMALGIGRKR
ncbi:MAG: FAD-binding protein, partial [Chloroflexi bacterium]|nr:FAD-binding protein [Chloroflexota bacterium]